MAYLSIHTLCMGSNKTELKFSQNYVPNLAYDLWYWISEVNEANEQLHKPLICSMLRSATAISFELAQTILTVLFHH